MKNPSGFIPDAKWPEIRGSLIHAHDQEQEGLCRHLRHRGFDCAWTQFAEYTKTSKRLEDGGFEDQVEAVALRWASYGIAHCMLNVFFGDNVQEAENAPESDDPG